MIVNAIADDAMMAPTPKATANTAGIVPTVFPTTLSTPARRPRAIERPTTKSTLGPGTTMMTIEAIVKAARFSTGNMGAFSLRTVVGVGGGACLCHVVLGAHRRRARARDAVDDEPDDAQQRDADRNRVERNVGERSREADVGVDVENGRQHERRDEPERAAEGEKDAEP